MRGCARRMHKEDELGGRCPLIKKSLSDRDISESDEDDLRSMPRGTQLESSQPQCLLLKKTSPYW